MGAPKTVDEAAVLAMLADGATPLEVASKLDVSEGHAQRLLLRHKLDTPAIREKQAAFRAARAERCRTTLRAANQVRIPEWVRRAGLESDYRDHALISGEYEAARLCRSLTAEMRRAAI